MPSVDELCRSYLDLKYHFDPAAASSAGLVSHDSRLGRFDQATVRAHIAALRSVAGAVEELETEDLQEEIDRTALLGELRSTIFRFENERPHERNPVLWINHIFQGLYAVLSRSNGAVGARAPAALERLRAIPDFLETARASLDEPPSVFVDSALSMLGGGGELVVQLAAVLAAETPELADELRTAAGAGLEALKRFGTALRDEVEPSSDPHAFAIGEEQFARRLHFEHAVTGGAPELWRYGLHLQEETTAQLVALAAELGARPWRELVDELRNDVHGQGCAQRVLLIAGSTAASVSGTRPSRSSGSERNRRPVAAKSAFASAGATATIGVSPAPADGASGWSSSSTSIGGTSVTRGTRYACIDGLRIRPASKWIASNRAPPGPITIAPSI